MSIIEGERDAYRAELDHQWEETHLELKRLYATDPKWPLINADNANQYRAALRSRMRWLDVWEEALDLALARSLAEDLGPG